jgi:hypothetical protein
VYQEVGVCPPGSFLVADSPISAMVMSILAMQGPSYLGSDWHLAAARIRGQLQIDPGAGAAERNGDHSDGRGPVTARREGSSGSLERIARAIAIQAEKNRAGRLVARILDRVWRDWERQLWKSEFRTACDVFRDSVLQEARYRGIRLLQEQLHLTCNSVLAACAYEESMEGRCHGGVLSDLAWLAQRYAVLTAHMHVAILQRQPRILRRNTAGVLHRDGGPAIRYRDGFAVWALNGLRVPRWLARTPATQLDPRRVLRIRNADTRREFVRKVGIERVCYATRARTIDRQGNYELLQLDLRDGWPRPYLKMLNPSIGTWHVEGVDPSCRTVSEALVWRNGTSETPESLT